MLLHVGLGAALLAARAAATAYCPVTSSEKRETLDKLVFAHFMIGIVGDRESAADYDADFEKAKALDIDAFALNIGTDDYTDTQLGYAYEAAANHDMAVFISFDFSYWDVDDPDAVAAKIKQYANVSGQLTVDDGKVFASSFQGDSLDHQAVKDAAGVDIFWVPNVYASRNLSDVAVDGAFSWQAWDTDGNNGPPTSSSNVTVEEGDAAYLYELNGKPYLAPASPWFFTHYGSETSYPKNYLFPGDWLWLRRWNELLTVGSQWIEIISWNDYGESHYIGPLSSKHSDDGASKWVNDMPHQGWGTLAHPFIKAFKAGATAVEPYITDDEIVYWYRPQLKTLDCDATDNCGAAPDGVDTVSDSLFVVVLAATDGSAAGGTLTATSGSTTETFAVEAGVNAFTVPLGVGAQTFALTSAAGATVLSGTSAKNVSATCVCGLYNFNAYVGTLPAGEVDSLGSEAFASFTTGLKVSTCSPTPTLTAA